MAQAVGLASMLPVDEDMEMTESGTENAAEVLHRSVFFNVSIDDVTKLLSGAFRDTGSGEVANFTSAQLREFSLDFKDRIGPFHFGAVYRGNINGKTPGSVLLKIWDDYYAIYLETRENPNIFIDEEAMFLKDKAIASHPSFPKVIGKCCSENLRGVVYDLDPLDSLQNMMPKNSFGWAQRIRVAVKLAQLLEFLHCQENPYVVLNLSAQHIMLDHVSSTVIRYGKHKPCLAMIYCHADYYNCFFPLKLDVKPSAH
ncbi:OLC1v1035612C1 [Oldenlandia corymbosa var. corymbosa]|uniref:OLC1v1035612C1 n=1 Tax=Oldenlandia corymbosa var. corymbosa TaxID=529605 RepID=A0AAV1CTD7_OLDCO|nr:OLC1v1035612C1 [Oldenlandia corymbosa var. corymbosa]